ncbi:hypothetical protein [Rubritalea tangerina]|uniref:hypothetical protein n=1 Tax=Rubritalea tangerina TaxID=430798 RepID=UPI00361586A7
MIRIRDCYQFNPHLRMLKKAPLLPPRLSNSHLSPPHTIFSSTVTVQNLHTPGSLTSRPLSHPKRDSLTVRHKDKHTNIFD